MTGFSNIDHGVLTDVGVRRSHNQDAHATVLAGDPRRFAEQGHLFLVADGMGGHAVGEKASAKAARDIPHTYLKHAAEGPAPALRRAFAETNAGIHAIGQKNPEFQGLGTTATMLLLRPEGAWVGHVGDSRAYRIRGGRIDQLTFDHSLIWEMARRHRVNPEDLAGLRSNVIVRSLGPDSLVQVDVEGPHPVEPGDLYLLCSDGLSGQLSDPEIGAIATSLPPDEACQLLVELANLRGGPDNTTVLIVRVGEPDPAAVHRPTPPAVPEWVRRIPWPLYVLVAGLALTIAAVDMLIAKHPAGVAAFVLAALAIGGGLAGLLLHAKRERQRVEAEPPPPKLNVYRASPCPVEPGVIDKLAKAAANLRAYLRERNWEADWDAYDRHVAEAERLTQAGDLVGAFREHGRAMRLVAKAFHSQRGKEEVFQPVWDKPAAR